MIEFKNKSVVGGGGGIKSQGKRGLTGVNCFLCSSLTKCPFYQR